MTRRGNAPVSPVFDDVYYSADDGIAESKFVFLDGINFPACTYGTHSFTIGETGFGTGLNFLLTWKAFLEAPDNRLGTNHLTFISIEGYPLSLEALQEAHKDFPELAEYAEELQKAWPPAAEGYHLRQFSGGRVKLLLLFGDAAKTLKTLEANIDAWFLDGFAPSKNKAMWSEDVLFHIGRTSNTGAKLATFTAAGFVRRGLEANGFEMQKAPGFGRKRERLLGVKRLNEDQSNTRKKEWALLPKATNGIITVIGGGIAGAWIAYTLQSKGKSVQIVDEPHDHSARHLPAALIAPAFYLEDSPRATLLEMMYLYTCQHPLIKKHTTMTGVEILANTIGKAEKFRKLVEKLKWGNAFISSNEQGDLSLPISPVVDAEGLIAGLKTDIHTIRATVDQLERHDATWQLYDKDGKHITSSDTVIIAAGAASERLLGNNCPEMRLRAGQVEVLQRGTAAGTSNILPEKSLSYGGYLTVSADGHPTAGSTFEKLEDLRDFDRQPNEKSRRTILRDLVSALTYLGRLEEDHQSDWSDILRTDHSWRGVRATTPDHLPYVGPVLNQSATTDKYQKLKQDAKATGLGAPCLQENLYVFSGFGSKGFQYAPLLAEYLAASLDGTPSPLRTDQMHLLHPGRDLIRKLSKGYH
ncbi:hypothetical protein GCM10017044_21950 [Kordiimonas sediminis]|uniref:tRNA 5-methylaminomethyl-2-thiouridine biosynthesis bifunctional protein MnmC n=1 Tax=Kordiimonas sediminis TaxID=1735581 RepID=A0A919AV11_9PROT|nr:hypothetical protein GCM10017044_21950 [Kordiimonas sediminis]